MVEIGGVGVFIWVVLVILAGSVVVNCIIEWLLPVWVVTPGRRILG